MGKLTMAETRILAIIPARGGSERIPRKNLRKLCGKPLIVWTIEAAKQSRHLNWFAVSTEDKEIEDVSRSYGVDVILRPKELACNNTPMLPVLQHFIKDLVVDIVVLLQPTSPLRVGEDIDLALQKFTLEDCDSMVSVCRVKHPYSLGNNRLTLAEDIYQLNGAIYITKSNIILNENRILGANIRPYIMPPERSVDIDTELDFKLAEILMKEKQYA